MDTLEGTPETTPTGVLQAAQAISALAAERRQDEINDHRPRFQNINISLLGGRLRLRRLQPEQVLALADHLQSHSLSAVTQSNRELMAKAVHVGLCPMDSPSLLLPGEEGLNRIKHLPDAVLLDAFQQAVAFNEIPVESSDGDSTL